MTEKLIVDCPNCTGEDAGLRVPRTEGEHRSTCLICTLEFDVVVAADLERVTSVRAVDG